VRAVLAESFERIHRSNLVGMGILPLQFIDGDGVESLGLTGEEVFAVHGLREAMVGDGATTVTVTAGTTTFAATFAATVRLDTTREVDYYRHGGIMRYVLRGLLTDR
jgi:aconitate hydratase